DPAANTIDFGSAAGFARNEPLVYDGPDGSNPGISGLTPGQVYYARVPDPLKHPGVIRLVDAGGNVVPVSLPSGSTTTVHFGALTNAKVGVGDNSLTFIDPDDPNTPVDPGFAEGDAFVYEGIGATYPVTINSAAHTIDLGFDPEFVANQALL